MPRFLRCAVQPGGKMLLKLAGRDAFPILVAASPRCAVSPQIENLRYLSCGLSVRCFSTAQPFSLG